MPKDHSHIAIKQNGQQKDYVVLTPEERAKGFVRPVRRTYIHLSCNTPTTMHQDIAETYARDPKFYRGTFCVNCRSHFPLDEFVWQGITTKVGERHMTKSAREQSILLEAAHAIEVNAQAQWESEQNQTTGRVEDHEAAQRIHREFFLAIKLREYSCNAKG